MMPSCWLTVRWHSWVTPSGLQLVLRGETAALPPVAPVLTCGRGGAESVPPQAQQRAAIDPATRQIVHSRAVVPTRAHRHSPLVRMAADHESVEYDRIQAIKRGFYEISTRAR